MATVSDLTSRVRSLTGIHASAVLSDAEVLAFLSEAQQTILHSADFPFLVESVTFSVAAGTDVQSVSLSRSSQRVLDVFAKYTTNEKPWQMFERGAPFISEVTDGHPTEFAWDASSAEMTFWPAPGEDIVVTARFVLTVPQIAVDADIVIPDGFAHAVSYLAAANILVREADESDRAGVFTGQAFDIAQQMRKVYMTSSRGSFVVGGRRGYRRSARRGAW